MRRELFNDIEGELANDISLEVGDKRDDNGNAMLYLSADTGYSGCCPSSVGVWMKRIVEGKETGLSVREREVLGEEERSEEEFRERIVEVGKKVEEEKEREENVGGEQGRSGDGGVM